MKNMKNKSIPLACLVVLLVLSQHAFAQNVSMTATVDPENKIVETDENNSEIITAPVVETTPLHMLFRPVDFYNTENFSTSVRDISSFLKATYPISEESFFVTTNSSIYQTNDAERSPIIGFQLVALSLRIQQNLTLSPYPTKIFAIIPGGWLSGNAVGQADQKFGVFFVEPWFRDSNNELVYMPSNGAHELGHSYDYGLCDEYSYCSWLAEYLIYLPNNGGCGNSFPFVCSLSWFGEQRKNEDPPSGRAWPKY